MRPTEPSTPEIWALLVDAAAPFELRMDFPAEALLPDLVLHRPPGGGEVVRLRYLEPKGGAPHLRTLFPHAVSAAEQADVEAQLRERLLPVLGRFLRQVVLVRLWEQWTSMQ